MPPRDPLEDSDGVEVERRDRTTPPLGGIEWVYTQIHALEQRHERLRKAFDERDRAYAVDRAYLLGAEGRPGVITQLEATTAANAAKLAATDVEHATRIGVLETWRTSFMAKLAVVMVLGTTASGIATAILIKLVTR